MLCDFKEIFHRLRQISVHSYSLVKVYLLRLLTTWNGSKQSKFTTWKPINFAWCWQSTRDTSVLIDCNKVKEICLQICLTMFGLGAPLHPLNTEPQCSSSEEFAVCKSLAYICVSSCYYNLYLGTGQGTNKFSVSDIIDKMARRIMFLSKCLRQLRLSLQQTRSSFVLAII